VIPNIFIKLWRGRFNIVRRAFCKISRILINRFNLFNVPVDFQNRQMNSIGLDREKGLRKLNHILKDLMDKSYDENDGMFSEHLILISSISVARQDISRILEIGTYDGRTALILSRLFPKAEIITIDLPGDNSNFKKTYNRKHSAEEFIEKRNSLIRAERNIDFRESDSVKLCQWDENFDLIWIDGAHGYPVAAMDIINSYRLANKNAFVLIDDIWKKAKNTDSFYISTAGYESLNTLKNAKLISEYFLFPKRLGGIFNHPGNKKYVGCFIK